MAITNNVKARIRIASKKEAEWMSSNPVALAGEWMVSNDTSPLKIKIGDGTSTWSVLDYVEFCGDVDLSSYATIEYVDSLNKTLSYAVSFGTCDTEAKTTAKVVAISDYSLLTGRMVSIKFTNSVPADATLNINSTGDKAIYYNGEAIVGDIINEGNTVTFIFDGSYYHLIAVDRMTKVTDTIENSDTTVPSGAALSEKFNGLMDDLFTVVSTWG